LKSFTSESNNFVSIAGPAYGYGVLPPNKWMQLTCHSTFQSTFGMLWH